MKKQKEKEQKKVLCFACGKPIKVSDWGGVMKGDKFFHNNGICLQKVLEEKK